MIPYETLLRDFLETLTAETEELRFLRSVPWVIHTHQQTFENVSKGLCSESERFAEIPNQFVFSLIAPLRNPPPQLLSELILSVRCQSWLRWELILVDDASDGIDHLRVVREWSDRDPRIKLVSLAEGGGPCVAKNVALAHARGDFIGVLGQLDILHPSALGIFARRLNRDPGANLIFSNEGGINGASDRVSGYLSKPPFDLFTLLRSNYVGQFTAIRSDLLRSAWQDGAAFRPGFEGVEDHDLLLRVALTGKANPIHVPLCLYYRRVDAAGAPAATTDLVEGQKSLLDDLIPEVYPGARWEVLPPSTENGRTFASIRITALSEIARPSLLVMVPFKDHLELTLRCVESIERQQHDLDVLVILINNCSEEPETITELMRWLDQPRRNRFECVSHEGPFNYARIHNLAIDNYGRQRDLLLFLNNDVELITPDCLQSLAMQLLADPLCGFVGIKLVFPGGRDVQHGGIQFHQHHLSCGYYLPEHAREPRDFVHVERIAFGVTFACSMVRREVFAQLGGLDEIQFPNGYGDVDIGIRALELGYRSYYFGTLVGIHHESWTRGQVSEESEFAALHERHGHTISYWKQRQLSVSPQAWPSVPAGAVTPDNAETAEIISTPHPPRLSFRYKIADRLNQVLKLALVGHFKQYRFYHY